MEDAKRSISELQAADLQDKLGLSRSYAFELVKRQRKPSLEVAVKIERQFGVPASAWIDVDAPEAAA